MTAADFRSLDALLDGRSLVDVACPWCGPDRRAATNQRRKVLRLWASAGFISYHCCRCGEHGFVRDTERHRPVNSESLRRARAMMAERERVEAERRHKTAIALWRMRRPIRGTAAEIYLREARGIGCELPPTLGYLPPRGLHLPALIAAFGIPEEPEPGALTIANEAVAGVHITKLRPDGSSKADVDPNKIMVGRSAGFPIVLAPLNDLLGLAITEGIEDALSVHAATGLGAWAGGAASRLLAVANAVPGYCDCVSIFADADETGQDKAAQLAERLDKRGIHAEVMSSSGAQA